MLSKLWRLVGRHTLCGTALLATVNLAHAQDTEQVPRTSPSFSLPMTVPVSSPSVIPSPTSNADEMKARLDRLEKQNQDLMKALQAKPVSQSSMVVTEQAGGLNKDDVQKIVGDYMASKAAQEKENDAAKKLEQEQRGFVVGQNRSVTGAVSPSTGGTGSLLWFESQDKAFKFHFGGRVQWDVIFGASASGADVEQGKGGTGPFLEGSNFRRARLAMDGWLYETMDFMVEFDWANTPFNTGVGNRIATAAGTPTGQQPFNNILNVPAPTDVWAGINFLPGLGSIRVGNIKPPIGLDHLTSSRFLDFMERSIGFDQYYNRNNGFEPGFMLFNNNEAQTLTWAFAATKTANGPFGFDQGGGVWDYTARVTWLPYYEDNGRRMIHLGVGGKYQRLDPSNNLPTASFNERWLLRNSQSGLQNAVAFVNLIGKDQEIINPEFFMNMGRLSVQAEYVGSRVNGVTQYNTQLSPINGNGGVTNTIIPSTTFYSQTAYIQAMYFLTGEHRPYGKTQLHGSGAAPSRVIPNRNFFWVPGQGCTNPFSAGAWQVGARYCYSTLNSGDIKGGEVNEITLGVNWFLNPNMKFQWNYDWGYRDLSAGGGTSNGSYQGFGMRMAFDF